MTTFVAISLKFTSYGASGMKLAGLICFNEDYFLLILKMGFHFQPKVTKLVSIELLCGSIWLKQGWFNFAAYICNYS